MSEEYGRHRGALDGPTDKERKYDRQLRLWAASGQAALESANMLLVNTGSGTVGVEALKNLVLPGLFTQYLTPDPFPPVINIMFDLQELEILP